MQWAAVKTWVFVTKDPPHSWSQLFASLKPPKDTIQGNSDVDSTLKVLSVSGKGGDDNGSPGTVGKIS